MIAEARWEWRVRNNVLEQLFSAQTHSHKWTWVSSGAWGLPWIVSIDMPDDDKPIQYEYLKCWKEPELLKCYWFFSLTVSRSKAAAITPCIFSLSHTATERSRVKARTCRAFCLKSRWELLNSASCSSQLAFQLQPLSHNLVKLYSPNHGLHQGTRLTPFILYVVDSQQITL